jgi:hypothetical protein
VGQLLVCGLRIGPVANHDATTIYQDRAIRREKITEHSPCYVNPAGASVRKRTVARLNGAAVRVGSADGGAILTTHRRRCRLLCGTSRDAKNTQRIAIAHSFRVSA